MAITDAKIEKERDNKMLKRKELAVSLEFDGATPSREEIKKTLADRFNLKQENLVVVRTSQLYGTKAGSALVHEYHDKEAMKIAQKHMISRPNAKKGKAQPASTATAAAASAEQEKGKKE
jgi:small subunit ribosomal protein S24e